MTSPTLQISDVIYNAATQQFEALVRVHDAGQVRSYPCAIPAPITLSFEDAAIGLTAQAMRHHSTGTDISGWRKPAQPPRRVARKIWRIEDFFALRGPRPPRVA